MTIAKFSDHVQTKVRHALPWLHTYMQVIDRALLAGELKGKI